MKMSTWRVAAYIESADSINNKLTPSPLFCSAIRAERSQVGLRMVLKRRSEMLFRCLPIFMSVVFLWSGNALASTSTAWECAPELFRMPNWLYQRQRANDMLIQQKVIKDEYARTEQIYFSIGDITRLGQHVMILLDEGKGNIRLGAGIYIQTRSPVFEWILRNKRGERFPVSIVRSETSSMGDSTRRWKYWLTAMFPKDYQLDSDALTVRLDAQDGEQEQFEFSLDVDGSEIRSTIACIKGNMKPKTSVSDDLNRELEEELNMIKRHPLPKKIEGGELESQEHGTKRSWIGSRF